MDLNIVLSDFPGSGSSFQYTTQEKMCFLHNLEKLSDLSVLLCRKHGKSN